MIANDGFPALGQFVAGQFVADNSSRTIRRIDNSSHGQFVAWTIRCEHVLINSYMKYVCFLIGLLRFVSIKEQTIVFFDNCVTLIW